MCVSAITANQNIPAAPLGFAPAARAGEAAAVAASLHIRSGSSDPDTAAAPIRANIRRFIVTAALLVSLTGLEDQLRRKLQLPCREGGADLTVSAVALIGVGLAVVRLVQYIEGLCPEVKQCTLAE